MSAKNNRPCSFREAKIRMALEISRARAVLRGHCVHRIEIRIKPIDPLAWLVAQESAVKIYGANQDDSAAIAGIGEAVCVQGSGRVDYPSVFRRLRKYLKPQYPYLQWYGGFCFDDRAAGSFRFVLPRFELARDRGRMIFCCNLIGPLSPAALGRIIKELDRSQEKVSLKNSGLKAVSRRDSPSFKQWEKNVRSVLSAIERGKYQKVVLARKTILTFVDVLNPWVMLKRLRKVTRNSYHFCFQFGPLVFLGASPERLYKRQGRGVLSEAVAGTCRRGRTSVEDRRLKTALTCSSKNTHEHALVVEAIQENLGGLCRRLDRTARPGILSLGNGHHLLTKFKGQLKDGVKDEDVLQCLHPTPALGGSPKEKAMAVIRALEPFDRGWYGGPLGYVGLDWAEFVVGIRSALVKSKQLSVYAGAGIVEGSKPKAEWQEIENKIGNFIKIIA